MTLYLRLGAYVLAAVLLVAGGWHMGGLAPRRDLAALQAQGWQQKAQAASAALAATQAQLKTAQATASANASTMQELQSENATIAADRDANVALAQRLLNSAARPLPAGGAAVSKAQSGSAAPAASAAGSNESAAGLLADTAAECERNADRLDALIAEVTPQL